jgi:hypothetical protein
MDKGELVLWMILAGELCVSSSFVFLMTYVKQKTKFKTNFERKDLSFNNAPEITFNFNSMCVSGARSSVVG